MTRTNCWPFSIVLASLMLGGCSDELPTGTVAGRVTLDGQPVKDGLVKFVPVAGDLPTADARIVDGVYEAVVPVGKFKVQISASRKVGQIKMYDTPDSPVVDKMEEIIPPRYNVSSDMTIDVARGKNSKDFELSGK